LEDELDADEEVEDMEWLDWGECSDTDGFGDFLRMHLKLERVSHLLGCGCLWRALLKRTIFLVDRSISWRTSR